jgi:hypothetical protein
MIRNAFILITLLTCSAAAVAEPSKDKGFYLAGAYGRSIYDEGGSFGNFGDDEDNSYHIAVGYKIFRYLSVEARYANFGSFNFLFENFDVDATSLHVVGIAPFGQSGWEFFGQLGIGTVNRDVRGFGGLDDSAAAGGIGFRWYPKPNFALGIQTDVYVWDDNNDWESSVGATQLSLQVIF